MSNLNWNVEEWHLDEFFSDAGEILNITIVKNDMGRSRGFGFIEFLHRRGASQALYKDGEDLMNRQIFVKMQNPPRQRDFTPREDAEERD